MLKKTLSIIIVLCLMLSLAACGKDSANTQAPEPAETPAATEPEVAGDDNGEEPVNIDVDDFAEVFNDFLMSFMDDHYDETFETVCFWMAFVDDDSVPDLVVLTDIDTPAEAFAYENGEVTKIGDFPGYNDWSYYKEYFCDSCYSDRVAILKAMYEAACNGEDFNGLVTDEMRNMVGDWELDWADYWLYSADIYGNYYTSDDAAMSLTVAEDMTASYWFHAYDETDAFYEQYSIPMYYLDTGVYDGGMNDDFNVKLMDYSQAEYDAYFTTYENGDGEEMMEFMLFIFDEDGDDDGHLFAYLKRAAE